MRSVLVFLLRLPVFVPLACSSSSPGRPAGTACASDSDCVAGLSCLSIGTVTDAGCTAVAKSCSRSCVVTVDCANLGPKFVCLMACDGTLACGATL